jgi:hypothetical protein
MPGESRQVEDGTRARALLAARLGWELLREGDGPAPDVNGMAASGAWMRPAVPFRVRVLGTGSLTMDARDSAGTVTAAVFQDAYATQTDAVIWPYPGDSARQVRFNFPSTLTIEVL